MTLRLSSDIYYRLLAVTRSAIEKAGGSGFVAEEILGIRQRQHVERWYSQTEFKRVLDNPESEGKPRSIPLFKIAELEAALVSSGHAPFITRALADLSGNDLVPRPEIFQDRNPVCAIGHLMKEAGTACETVTEAIADGKITPDEKQKCVTDLQQVINAASAALASLAGADCDAD